MFTNSIHWKLPELHRSRRGFKRYRPAKYFCLEQGSQWFYIFLKYQWFSEKIKFNIRKILFSYNFCCYVGSLNYVSVVLRGKVCIASQFCRAKSALLHNCAGQGMKAWWICRAKSALLHILWDKVCIAQKFCGEKNCWEWEMLLTKLLKSHSIHISTHRI